MTNHASERFTRLMPEYQKQEIGGWEIEASPAGKWRALGKAINLEFPYFVGDKINLDFTLKRVKSLGTPINASHILVAYYPHNEGTENDVRIKRIPEFDQDQTSYSFNFESITELSKDGTTSIYITSVRFMDKSFRSEIEKLPLFTAGVKHKDLVRWDIFLILLGVIGGGICGCLASFALLFIRVAPYRDIWIPYP